MDTIILSIMIIMKVYYNARNKFVKTSKYTFKSLQNVDKIRWIFLFPI